VGDSAILILIVVVIGGVLAAVAGYYIVRFMKGTIKVTMPRTSFQPGEAITGSFELAVKKPVEGNQLKVSLICVEQQVYYRGGKRHTRSQEIYRDEIVIEDARSYPPGHQAVHKFEIRAPEGGLSALPDAIANNTVVQAIGTVARAMGAGRRRLTWRVEARLDAKGVDLPGSKKVYVSTPGLL